MFPGRWILLSLYAYYSVSLFLYVLLGSDKIRPYWSKYFSNQDGVVRINALIVKIIITTLQLHVCSGQNDFNNLVIRVLFNLCTFIIIRFFSIWFFQSMQIFVIDSTSSQESLCEAKKELQQCVSSDQLQCKPVLILCTKQDKPDAKSCQEVSHRVILTWIIQTM